MKVELVIPQEKEQSEQERKDYCAAIFAIFPRIEKDIKEMMYDSLVKTYTEAKDFNEVTKGQGILEGMAILLTRWQQANAEHIASVTNKDEEV